MEDILLIDKEDFAPYRALTNNTDVTKKVYPCVREAQEFTLAAALGARLYNDLIKYTESYRQGLAAVQQGDPPYTPTDTEIIFDRLLNGVKYTIHSGTDKEETVNYKGIKPALVYFTWSRYVITANLVDSPTGFVNKKTLESEPAAQKELIKASERAEQGGYVFIQGVHKYIANQKFIADGDEDWFKRYGLDCCNDHCSRRSAGKKSGMLKGVRKEGGLSSTWNKKSY